MIRKNAVSLLLSVVLALAMLVGAPGLKVGSLGAKTYAAVLYAPVMEMASNPAGGGNGGG